MNDAAKAPRAARAFAARVGAVFAAGGVLTFCGFAASHSWPPARGLASLRGSGWLALSILLAALCIAPIERGMRALGRNLTTVVTWPALRRALGMTAAWLALLHASLAYSGPLQGRIGAAFTTSHLVAGVTALFVLLVLLLTSFDPVLRVLRLRYWKELHRLSYVAALLVLQHLLLSPSAPRKLVLGVAAGLALLVALRLPWRPTRQARSRAPANATDPP